MAHSRLQWFHRFWYRLANVHRLDFVKKLRGWHYRGLLAYAGANLRISEGVIIYRPSMVSIGDNCFIGVGAQFYPWNERISIGNNVLIAAGVRMITRKHGFADIARPMSDQGYDNAPIVIEDDVWIGFQSIILPNVTVGCGSIVGAGAVVTRDVEPYSVVGGVPARLIRKRSPWDVQP